MPMPARKWMFTFGFRFRFTFTAASPKSQGRECLRFKFDIPTHVLLSDDRHEVTRMVHETAASIEQFARSEGWGKAQGLAAGSCKKLFCGPYETCHVLAEKGDCRFSDLARPSMSGLGINFFKLSAELGWQMERISHETHPDEVPMGMMAGMVLLGKSEI